jgi:hypothetical protein
MNKFLLVLSGVVILGLVFCVITLVVSVMSPKNIQATISTVAQNPATQTMQTNPKDTALHLAETELHKHYPNHKRNGQTFQVVSEIQIKATPDEWIVTYDLPSALDGKVEIIVDTKTGTILSYQDSWS